MRHCRVREGKNGELIWYAGGWGTGYVVPTAEKRTEIESISFFGPIFAIALASLPAVICTIAAIEAAFHKLIPGQELRPWMPTIFVLSYAAGSVPPVIFNLIQAKKLKRIREALAPSNDWLSRREAFAQMAREMNRLRLSLDFIASGLIGPVTMFLTGSSAAALVSCIFCMAGPIHILCVRLLSCRNLNASP